jgi:hypothetical protein
MAQQETQQRLEREVQARLEEREGGLFAFSVDFVGEGTAHVADYLSSSFAIFQPRPAGALQAALSFDQRAAAAKTAAAGAAVVAVAAAVSATVVSRRVQEGIEANQRAQARAMAVTRAAAQAAHEARARREAQQAEAASREAAEAAEDAEDEREATSRRRQRYERVLRAVYGGPGGDSAKLEPAILEQILDHWQHRPKGDLLNLLGEKYGKEQRARAAAILTQAEANERSAIVGIVSSYRYRRAAQRHRRRKDGKGQ